MLLIDGKNILIRLENRVFGRTSIFKDSVSIGNDYCLEPQLCYL